VVSVCESLDDSDVQAERKHLEEKGVFSMTRQFTKQAAAIFATCGLAATCAMAQPTPDAIVTVNTVGTQVAPAITVGAGEVRWIRIDLGVNLNATTSNFLDIIGGNTAGTAFDTEFFLFDNAGTYLVTDDDDGPGAYSQFSFGGGCGSAARSVPTGEGVPTLTAGLTRNGADGARLAGTYWLAIGGFNSSQTTAPWGVSTTSTLSGTVNATFDLGTAGTAPVTPSTNLINIGSMTNPQTYIDSQNFGGSTVRWYQFTVPAVGAAAGNSYLDIVTTQGATGGAKDTELTLYRADGTLVAFDDEDGPGSYSALSFGLATPTRPAPPPGTLSAGVAFNGRDGATLAAGTYYLATSYFSTTNGATCFGAVSTSTTAAADTVTRIVLGNFASLPPVGTAASSPTSVNNCGTGTTLLTVNVTPGNNPVSTGLAVTGDLTAIGGSATQAFVDDGTGGDAVAGDNIFSYTATVPNTVTTGAKTLNYSITDAQARSSTATGAVTVVLCPPSVPPCPVGTSVVSGANLDSVGPIGAGNGIVTNTVSGLGTVNKIHVSGLVQEVNTATYASEARLRVTTPSGAQYNFQFSPDIAFPLGGTYLSIADQSVEIPAESGDGVWTAEVFESFDDAGIDARWQGLCVTAENTSTQPIVSGVDWSVDLISATLGGPFASSSSVLTATVTPGSNPTSTGLVVTADLSLLGGSGTAAMNDGGTDGDALAGDGIYSLTFTATGTTPTGGFATPISVSDAQGRSASGTANLSVGSLTALGSIDTNNDGLLVDGANVASGEVKWYSFELCNDVDAAQSEWFDIHTNGSVLGDTEIGLYDASGNLVSSDDDSGLGLKSFLTYGTGSGADIDGADSIDVSDGFNGAVLPAGTYYLAAGAYNMTFGATGFAVTTGTDAGTIQITFDTNNSCVTLPTCGSIDFNGDGLFPDDSDLVDFLNVLAGGECSTGTCDTIDFNRDGLFPDDNDLVDFLTVLAGGTPTNCIP
jgi:hypothetical protein